MRALAPTLLLLTSRALAAAPSAPDAAGPAPVSAPVPVAPGTPGAGREPVAAPAPVTAPVPVKPSHDPPAPARAPEPMGTVAPDAVPARRSPPPAPVVPTQALVEKLGQGDRLLLAGDHRNALFAYQDAVYMQPRYAPARVKLGRAYLALRYPAQAVAQAEAALAADPENADAKKLLEDAKNPAPRAVQGPPGAAPHEDLAARTSSAAVPPSSSTRPASPRVFRFTPEPEAPPASTAASPSASTAIAAGERTVTIIIAPSPGAPEPRPAAAPALESRAGADPLQPGPASDAAATGASAPSAAAAQHYRVALVQLQNREFANAVAELSQAILADPKLAVAHAARGSAHFGLGKYREAAEDYRAALLLDPRLATPVYGLAECYRVLGDAKQAVEMYERYAISSGPDVREDLRAAAAKRAQELR